MNGATRGGITRRTTLSWLGAAAVGATTTACRSANGAEHGPESDPPAATYTLEDWVAERGDHYLVAHRGVGDVLPEHSMESYQAAVGWGAKAMEVSVGVTADGVLVCMHDRTLDRTTNLSGELRAVSAATLQQAWLDVPRLGPYWQRARIRVPRFEDVLSRFGGRVILCVEAKDPAAHAPMMAMIRQRGLEASVMFKAYYRSKRIDEAKTAGLGVFGYFTTPAETTPEALQTLAAKLSPKADAIVVPNSGPAGYLADDLAAAAVATGIPIWPYPLHRRSDVAHYAALGMSGAVSSDIGYVSGKTPVAGSDKWARGAAVSGELTRNPYDDKLALRWGPGSTITLAAPGVQHFLTLGNLCPITAPAYTVEFEAAFDRLPADLSSNLTLAFGHQDDSYYEHNLSQQNGYHAILRGDGQLGLYAHHADRSADSALATSATDRPVPGRWMRFRLVVAPKHLVWSRLDVTTPAVVTAAHSSYRGGYLHLGRASTDGSLSLRRLRVTRTG